MTHAPLLLTAVFAALSLRATLATPLRVGANGTRACGSSPPWTPGTTAQVDLTFEGVSRNVRIHLPQNYDEDAPTPVVLLFHGWGSNGNSMVNLFRATADRENFIIVSPTGVSENRLASWNGGGTTESPGPAGPTCDRREGPYCYNSCSAREQGCDDCDWTNCYDDVAWSAFLLDYIEANACVDTGRLYASGHSNGGQFVYELGVQLAGRLAAVVPSAGQPHPGFVLPPTDIISIMDIHGANDNVCPANWTDPSSSGWWYAMVPDCLEAWAQADNCNRDLAHYPTSADGTNQLYCVNQGRCGPGTNVVRCAFNGGHGTASFYAQIAWEFMAAHPLSAAAKQQRTRRTSSMLEGSASQKAFATSSNASSH